MFRITAVCGDYYIGGRQFDSLTELVGFYSHCSDLLKRERLVEPVPPPEPVNDKKVMHFLYTYKYNMGFHFQYLSHDCFV